MYVQVFQSLKWTIGSYLSDPFYLARITGDAVYFIEQQVFKNWIGVNELNQKVSSLLEKPNGKRDVQYSLLGLSDHPKSLSTSFHYQNSSGAVQKMDNVWPQPPHNTHMADKDKHAARKNIKIDKTRPNEEKVFINLTTHAQHLGNVLPIRTKSHTQTTERQHSVSRGH